jgi:hypothetical protein
VAERNAIVIDRFFETKQKAPRVGKSASTLHDGANSTARSVRRHSSETIAARIEINGLRHAARESEIRLKRESSRQLDTNWVLLPSQSAVFSSRRFGNEY